ARNINEINKLRIINDIIVDADKYPVTSETRIIHADGMIVTPGLIDYHAHVFYDATEGGVRPDMYMPPNGVTTVVDAGSAGTANFDAFYRTVICASKVRIKAFLTVSPPGQTWSQENYDPDNIDENKIHALFRQYRNVLQGLKLKVQTEDIAEYGLKPLTESLRIANDLRCPVAIHSTHPVVPMKELVSLLRRGDIIAHAFHGKGSTILTDEGAVLAEVRQARERGVIFDAANGRSHFSMNTARRAIANGFLPDIISSDLSTITKLAWPVYALPWILSKYLALGVALTDVINACTHTPAVLMGMAAEIGTLAPGAFADIAIFKLKNRHVEFADIHGETLTGTHVLVPQMTIKSGEILFRQIDFGARPNGVEK
ncbi:metallo-dependent hydrolase, partial [Salmonella enterica]|nr:metallo-dependent hydrolase [Salmonella enterica]ECE6286253.1 metal-dependent hydrolase [Salmonella enterica subsp. salamae]EBT2588101.1 metallo-dependent hydrolase [Salmonella enterica]ECH3076266.1 metallo-dependent hydrolase [Salmonella enterica]ECH6105734.1 metallo-dependent hydrolase [Salmonella enterica]